MGLPSCGARSALLYCSSLNHLRVGIDQAVGSSKDFLTVAWGQLRLLVRDPGLGLLVHEINWVLSLISEGVWVGCRHSLRRLRYHSVVHGQKRVILLVSMHIVWYVQLILDLFSEGLTMV